MYCVLSLCVSEIMKRPVHKYGRNSCDTLVHDVALHECVLISMIILSDNVFD